MPECFGSPERVPECMRCGERFACCREHYKKSDVFLLPKDKPSPKYSLPGGAIGGKLIGVTAQSQGEQSQGQSGESESR